MKKALPAAVALVSSMGFTAAANAVNVNHDGLGQVLLYQYYTVTGGNDTLVNITNTTDYVKAVKVRFVEAMNSQEVLDFNLYLSPHDVWTGAVTLSSAGAKLLTADKSCTVPAIPAAGVEFRNFQYQGTQYYLGKGGPQGTDRTRTGHLEVIEMGAVFDNDPTTSFKPATWATHVNGVPANCAALDASWKSGGAWANNSNYGISTPSGGLYGSSIIVNVAGGTDIEENAVALDNFITGGNLHFAPGSLFPALENAEPFFALDDGTTGFPDSGLGIDAVSAVLQKASIANDYLTVSTLNASTDWVVTFPTKRYYVNGWTPTATGGVSASTPSPEPFTNFWTSTPNSLGVAGSACELIDVTYYDQEERAQQAADNDFSPAPVTPGISLCYEANVIGINAAATDPNVLGGGYTRTGIDLLYTAGWMSIDFTNGGSPLISPANGVSYDREIATDIGYIQGLPVIGFSATEFVNGNVGGLLSNYAGSTDHKATVVID